MLLSKTTQYALRVLSHMAASPEARCTADSLHEELDIPARYLRRLLTDLSKKGYIETIRGRSGGFRLGKKTPKTRVAQIIETVESLEPFHECLFGFERCRFDGACSLHDIWDEARQKLLQSFADTTLEQVLKRHKRSR
jgi:Rrf2 family protein